MDGPSGARPGIEIGVTAVDAPASAFPEPRAGEGGCADCGEPLTGRFCSACGQKVSTRPLSLFHLVGDFLSTYLTLEGRLPQTLVRLVLRPGALTKEFLEGRRTRYVKPVALYALTSVLFFAALHLGPHLWSGEVTLSVGKVGFQISRPEGSSEIRTELISEGASASPASGDPQSRLTAGATARAEKLFRSEHGRQSYLTTLLDNLPRAAFVLIPLLALFMRLFYWRPKRLYVDHVVFALHFQSFFFLGVVVVIALHEWLGGKGWAALALFACPAYALLGIRRAFGQGWGWTALKTVLFLFGYVTSGAIALLLLMMGSLWLA